MFIISFLLNILSLAEAVDECRNFLEPEEVPPYILHYAYAVDEGEVLSNTQEAIPLMSVFKIHLAVAVLQKMQQEGTPLTYRVDVPAACWEMDTWSPLRSTYRGRSVSLSLGDLLQASVSQSDNITTDVLIDYLGGMPALQAAMDASGIPCRLLRNEADMHQSPDTCADNTMTARAMIQLLRGIHQSQFLKGEYQDFLLKALYDCKTGANKIRVAFPQEWPLAHKTGSSGRDAAGVKLADNDAGFVLLPDGRTIYLLVFVTQASITDEECAQVIATKAGEIYQEVLSPRHQ